MDEKTQAMQEQTRDGSPYGPGYICALPRDEIPTTPLTDDERCEVDAERETECLDLRTQLGKCRLDLEDLRDERGVFLVIHKQCSDERRGIEKDRDDLIIEVRCLYDRLEAVGASARPVSREERDACEATGQAPEAPTSEDDWAESATAKQLAWQARRIRGLEGECIEYRRKCAYLDGYNDALEIERDNLLAYLDVEVD